MSQYQFIKPDKIKDMLFDDTQYITEFCEAGITSIGEFNQKFRNNLKEQDLEELKKAGHKIKPGAQMMGADEVVEEYEHAKSLLTENAEEHELEEVIQKMDQICTTIKKELVQLSKDYK